VFENRVLRIIFEPKRDEVTGGCRKLHNEELHNLYSSSSIIRMFKPRRLRCARHIRCVVEKTNAYKMILLGKPGGKRPLERPKRRWEDKIKIDLREIGWAGIDWIDIVHNRDQWRALVNTKMNLPVP
jgi:hypothetical protein